MTTNGRCVVFRKHTHAISSPKTKLPVSSKSELADTEKRSYNSAYINKKSGCTTVQTKLRRRTRCFGCNRILLNNSKCMKCSPAHLAKTQKVPVVSQPKFRELQHVEARWGEKYYDAAIIKLLGLRPLKSF